MTKKPPFFVLGAQDPEMREIEAILNQHKIPLAHAAVDNVRCHAGNAYLANSTVVLGKNGIHRSTVRPTNHDVVLVECSLKRVQSIARIDHHNPGDAGYDAPPERYMEGSSLGQVLTFLMLEPTETQRMLAAADHCLSAAYRGLCPGVDAHELLFLRASWQAKIMNRPLSDVLEGIVRAASIVEKHFNPELGEAAFLDPTRAPAELREGSAYAGRPVRYRSLTNGVLKEMIKGASASRITEFMDQHRAAGKAVYGNPHRGYAGAYL